MVNIRNDKKNYAEIAVPCPLRQTFDYLVPMDMTLKPGMRVKVSFGRRIVTGMVLKLKSQTLLKTEIKTILEQLDDEPIIPENLMQLEIWASQYYQHPIGDVLMGVLPTRLRQGKTINHTITVDSKLSENMAEGGAIHGRKGAPRHGCLVPKHVLAELAFDTLKLNTQQQITVENIKTQINKFTVFLLHGITGSGKTEVYFSVIEEVLKKNRNQQVLFLIPEISLSPQTLKRFQQRFTDIAVMHSALTDKERLTAWVNAREGQAKIIIGTRSAIFTPFGHLGLIIIDEEHDASFKQQTGFRYSARDAAIKRAHQLNIPIILGSATPSIESYHHALNKKYHLLELTERALNAKVPELKLISAPLNHLQNGLAPETIEIIQQHLKRKEQVLVFINRRGYAPTWFCQSCHWQANCTRCDSHLVLHKKDKKLICHHCGHQTLLNKTCPQCHSPSLLALGEGTQRIAEMLTQLFSDVPTLRIDRDNIKNKNQLEEHLEIIHQQQAAILVGTQMLAKGHHFPNVTLVVILGVDNGLMSNDFHALESTAQLILQVAGRAGRAEKSGTVLLQTLQPQHPQLLLLQQQNYGLFLQALLRERQTFQLPPFAYLALFRVEAKQKNVAWEAILELQKICQSIKQKSVMIYDPAPPPLQRKAGFYHFQLLLKADKRPVLHHFLEHILLVLAKNVSLKAVRWSIEIDPIDLF